MVKDVSFWLMVAGMVLTAIGAANPVHGTYFELVGIVCIIGTRFAAKRGY
jgi:hypothetical protein